MIQPVARILGKLKNESPSNVDATLVSSFLAANGIEVKKNQLLKNMLALAENNSSWHSSLLTELRSGTISFGLEELIECFEYVISPADKVVTGAVYTPQNIRNLIVSQVFSKVYRDKPLPTVCDPACGCGGFLLTAAREIKKKTSLPYREIFSKCLFGTDVMDYSIERTQILLSILAVMQGEDEEWFEFNLHQGNALRFDWSDHLCNFCGFDVVLGNPPYVCSRNIDKDSRAALANWSVCATGHPDLYIPFFELGMKNLKSGGMLGLITMNSFFKSLNGRALRRYFNDSRFEMFIVDFGSTQVFRSKSTYTCICFIEKRRSNDVKYVLVNDPQINKIRRSDFSKVPYAWLDARAGWNLQNAEVINKIESVGIRFGERFETSRGIATLKNEIYIFVPVKSDFRYYYLERNGTVWPIEKQACRDVVNTNKLAGTSNISDLVKKIIFPYEYRDNKIKIFGEQTYKEMFPKAHKYLGAHKNVLASRDNGVGRYERWFAFGRNQGLEKSKFRLLFPHIANSTPNFVLTSDENLLFYNGVAVLSDNQRELSLLRKIMQSRLFWFYVTNSSKPYGSNYYSLSENYIKNFGIFDFSVEDENYILHEKRMPKIDEFLESRYDVDLSVFHR